MPASSVDPNSTLTACTQLPSKLPKYNTKNTVQSSGPLSSIHGLHGIQASCLSEMVKARRAQGRMKICVFLAYEREIRISNWNALHGCKACRRAVRYFWCWMRLLVIKINFVGAARRTLAIDRQEGEGHRPL
jgi:hypothetical protein